jgi:hypothetical protein
LETPNHQSVLTFETEYLWLEFKNGIARAQYKPGVKISLEDARTIVRQRLEQLGDRQYPALVKSTKIKLLDRAAREYLFKEGIVNFKALAFIEKKSLEKMLGNAMLRISRPGIPCRIFSTEEEALEWLSQFV